MQYCRIQGSDQILSSNLSKSTNRKQSTCNKPEWVIIIKVQCYGTVKIMTSRMIFCMYIEKLNFLLHNYDFKLIFLFINTGLLKGRSKGGKMSSVQRVQNVKVYEM